MEYSKNRGYFFLRNENLAVLPIDVSPEAARVDQVAARAFRETAERRLDAAHKILVGGGVPLGPIHGKNRCV